MSHASAVAGRSVMRNATMLFTLLVLGCGSPTQPPHSHLDQAGGGSGANPSGGGGTGGDGGGSFSGGGGSGTGGGSAVGGGTGSGGGFAGGSGSGGGSGTGGGSSLTEGGDGGVPMGALTAGAWDDNLNFDWYQTFLANPPADAPSIARSDRVVVQVTDANGAAASGVVVALDDGSTTLDSTVTGADGRALFFPSWAGATAQSQLTVTASLGNATATAPVSAQGPVALQLSTAGAAVTSIDIAVVLDVTGSMGDEIAWLKAELASMAQQLSQAQPNLDVRWALLQYRDHGDDFVTNVTDFTTLAQFTTTLSGVQAIGGGDIPEALDQAVAAIPSLSWRQGNTARVVFHIADAPQHAGTEDAIVQALRAIRSQGVHVYPVAASGADQLLEATFRTEAEVTGGRYLFLTDDSGIGGSHEVPSIPCFYVTRLEKQIVRVLVDELTGIYAQPAPADVIRTGGDPVAGQCTLGNGTSLWAF